MLENPRPSRDISGERILLKARAIDQAPAMFALIEQNREHLRPWMPWEEFTKSIADSKAYLELAAQWWDKGTTFDYSLYEKTSGRMMGSFGLHSLDWEKRTCHLGYWIGREFEGQGYVNEAVRLGEQIVYSIGLHRVIITCDRLNRRSARVAEATGYRLEATMIDECCDRGRVRDTLQFVKLFNPPRHGEITENLPEGFSIVEKPGEEFWPQVTPHLTRIFDERELILRPHPLLSAREKEKLKALNAENKNVYTYHALLLKDGALAGWTWGYQDSRESFYMVNSAIFPEHRGRGLYTRLLETTVNKMVEKGFQKIWSRHNMLNNAIIASKLKKDFQITGTEINDSFGALVHMTLYTNKIRRKILQFRSGSLRPDQELKDILKI